MATTPERFLELVDECRAVGQAIDWTPDIIDQYWAAYRASSASMTTLLRLTALKRYPRIDSDENEIRTVLMYMYAGSPKDCSEARAKLYDADTAQWVKYCKKYIKAKAAR